MQDFQNPTDPMVLAIRTSDTPEVIGYCPRYLTKDIHRLIKQKADLQLTVSRVNEDAPLYYQLMCTLMLKKTNAEPCYTLFDDNEFAPYSA